MDEAGAGEGDELRLRLAPGGERCRPLARPVDRIDPLAAGDDGAIDDAGDHRRQLAGARRHHGLVEAGEAVGNLALADERPALKVSRQGDEIANQVASEFFYICSINLVAGGAQNVAIVEDDTDTCGSPTAGLNGGVTAGEGWNFAANGGIALGDGSSTVMKTSTANRYFCIITSAAAQLSAAERAAAALPDAERRARLLEPSPGALEDFRARALELAGRDPATASVVLKGWLNASTSDPA